MVSCQAFNPVEITYPERITQNNKNLANDLDLQCFSSKSVLTERKGVCLSINEAQSVRLEKETIEFKNYFKQILVPFKVLCLFSV